MRIGYHDKFYEFQTSNVIYRILKYFGHTFVVMVRDKRCSKYPSILWIRAHIGLNNINIIFDAFYSVIQNTSRSNLTYLQEILLMK